MTQYANVDYYKNTYGGSNIPDEYIDFYLIKASEKIDSLTFNRIVYMTFEKLTPFQQEKVQRSCCMCADYLYKADMDAAGAGNVNITSYKVLDIDVTIDNKRNVEDVIKNNYGIDQGTLNCLKQTGLMCGVI